MIKSFETILEDMLGCVSDSVDKREGSLIRSALAPVAAELAEGYMYLENYADLLLADTAVGEYLDRLCSLSGIERKAAVAAVVIGEFLDADNTPVDMERGLELLCGAGVYVVGEQVSQGKYLLTAKEPGTAGNRMSGELLPVDYVEGLMSAEIVGIESYGEDEEDDESLRARYIANMTAPAFGGNVSDYEKQVLAFDGVGAVKVFPVCSGAGTVGLVIGNGAGKAVDSALPTAVAAAFNKKDENNISCGLAPIGHTVYVKSAVELAVNVTATVEMAAGVTVAAVKPEVEKAVRECINGIDFDTGKINQASVMMAILQVDGVADVNSLRLNNSAQSLNLSKTYASYQVPVFGTLSLGV